LIELLVVVAIIALLISILLPSLSKARAQARSTVCATRIAQLTKAILIYADDFSETPPFMGIGWEDIRNPDKPSKDINSTKNGPADIPSRSKWEWAVNETWLTQHPELIWNGQIPEDQWSANGVGIKTGSLFGYARFENLYRCPEFERIGGGQKSQGAFNYTRTILGRKWIMGDIAEGGRESDYWGGSDFGAPGPIVRLSSVHAPSRLYMMMDEWWKRHVAAPFEEQLPGSGLRDSEISGGWSANDCVHFALVDEVGQYHGSPQGNKWFPPGQTIDLLKVQLGMLSFYDGHSELEREFWPGKSEANMGLIISAAVYIVEWLSGQTFNQRGKSIVGMPS